MKKRLVSGVKPTGRPHIGNYFGAMEQFVKNQDKYDSYIFIADYHSLINVNDRENLKNFSYEMLLDYLAIGLDPKKSVIYRQSQIPEVTELNWIFQCITTLPYLMRSHAYKDKTNKDEEVNSGLLNYPLLMAADILLLDADIVPVGKDQKQHIEYARDTAEKFNSIYGNTFKLPKELIIEEVSNIPGTDGRKMSKSYNNTIPLFASPEDLKKIVMSIETDSKGVDEPKDPHTNNIFNIHKLLLEDKDAAKLSRRYSDGGMGYKEAKELLLKDLINFTTPLREKREKLASNPKKVLKILNTGGKKAKKIVDKKMSEIRDKVGLTN